MSVEEVSSREILLYWQKKIFQSITKAILIVGFVAYVISLGFSIYFKVYVVALFDSLIYLAFIVIYFYKDLHFGIRVFTLNLILYLLGVGLLIYLGPYGAGWVWLFAFPILSTVLSGFRTFIMAVVLNTLTLLILGILLHQHLLVQFLINDYKIETWGIISVNFLCLNILLSWPLATLVEGLEGALKTEKNLRTLVKTEQEQIVRKNVDLVKINNDLDSFIYTASHDLKAPISNIEGLISSLEEELEEHKVEVNDILAMVHKSVERLKSTIKDLTEISIVQKNLDESLLEEVDLPGILHDIMEDFNNQDKKNAVITTDFKAEKIRFSKKNLRSIIYNLISNAIKYSSPERRPEILISTLWNGNIFVLTIKDNGLGMTEGYADKIFKMFKRMHDHVEGTGLGLYIVKKIVENNGGFIEVSSALGKGSTFIISIPGK